MLCPPHVSNPRVLAGRAELSPDLKGTKAALETSGDVSPWGHFLTDVAEVPNTQARSPPACCYGAILGSP